MKKTILTSALALTTAVSATTYADGKIKKDKVFRDVGHLSTLTAGAATGALLGGPIGMFIGAIGGALIIEKNQDKFDQAEALANEVNKMEETIYVQEVAIQELEQSAAEKLDFLVMFATGDDTLTFEDEQRIKSLAHFLGKNPKLNVRLDGYADPRGTDEYNNVLSSERAQTVAQLLEAEGIEPDRITLHSHGANFTIAPSEQGLYTLEDQYAFKRRVNIEVYSENGAVASNP